MAQLRSMQQTYAAMKGRGSSTAKLSSYAKTLKTRTQAAEDKIIDDNYANGLISTQAYLDALNQRSLRATLTPLQRTNLQIKIRDTKQNYTDEQIQTAYKTGGFYNGVKIDDAAMLAWEKEKLNGMDAGSTAYEQQAQKVAILQDKQDKAERRDYRLQEQLRLSQSPDYDYKIMEQKADLYQKLADDAKADGDNTQYMQFQTTANNYKESAQKAKVEFEYQQKLYKNKTETTAKKNEIKNGVPQATPTGVPSNVPPTQQNQPANTMPVENEDGTVTPGAPTGEQQVQTNEPQAQENPEDLLADLNEIDWQDLSSFYTEDDIKSASRTERSLESKQKAIQRKIADAQKAWDDMGAAVDAYDNSMSYDQKNKYMNIITTKRELSEQYTKDAEQMSEELDIAVQEAANSSEDLRKKVAKRILTERENRINLSLETLNRDLINGTVSKQEFLYNYDLLNTAKKNLADKGMEVFDVEFSDPDIVASYEKDSLNMSETIQKVEAYRTNPSGVELIMNANTGKVSPEFVTNEKNTVQRDKKGVPIPGAKSMFDLKFQKVGNAYVPVEYRDRDGKLLSVDQMKTAFENGDLDDPKKYKKEGTVWETVIHEEVDKNGRVINEVPERRMIKATFKEDGEIGDYTYTDANGETHTVTEIPIQEAGSDTGFLDKVSSFVKGAVNWIGDAFAQDRQNTANTMPQGPIKDFFSGTLLQKNAPALRSQVQTGVDNTLRSLSSVPNPFEIQKAYAQTAAQPTINNVPAQYAPKIIEAANKNGISPSTLAALLAQESWDFDEKYVSGYHTDGTGRGIAAIDKTWHPEVTDEQAFDPNFAIEWAAKEFSNLKKETGSEYDALRAYNAGLNGASSNPANGKGYADKVMARTKQHQVSTEDTENPVVLASASGLRSQQKSNTNYAGTIQSGQTLGPNPQPVQKATLRSQSSSNKSNDDDNIVKKVSNTVKKASDSIKNNSVVKAIDSVSTPQKAANTAVKAVVNNAPKIISTGIKVANTVNDIKKGFGNTVSNIKNTVSNTVNDIKKKASSGWNSLRSLFGGK